MMFSKFSGLFMQFNVYDLLNQWSNVGVFDYVLPFLLVFAVVFGILQQTGVLGQNKGVNMIVSLVLGLFVIRFANVTAFIGDIFANFGIALSVILVLMILTGLFVSKDNRKTWIKNAFGIAMISFAVVVIASLNEFAWFGSSWWQENWVSIVWIAVVILIIGSFFREDETKADWGKLEPVRELLGR